MTSPLSTLLLHKKVKVLNMGTNDGSSSGLPGPLIPRNTVPWLFLVQVHQGHESLRKLCLWIFASFTPGVEASQLCVLLKLANVGDGEAIEEVHQGDHHHQDEEDQEGEGGRGQC